MPTNHLAQSVKNPRGNLMASDILNGIALEIRTGDGVEGIRQLDHFLAEHPNDVDALALGAYENEVRDVKGVPKTYYLERLQAVAPDSALGQAFDAFYWLIDPVDAEGAFRRAKAAALRPRTTIGEEMYLLADVASSEAQFQILSPSNSNNTMNFTPRSAALVHLSQRRHDDAIEHFRKGAEMAQKVAGGLNKRLMTPLSEGETAKYALNYWNDCVVGEAMTMADLGQHEESRARYAWVKEQYSAALARIS